MPFSSIYREDVKTRAKALTPKMAEWVDLYMEHHSATKATELSSYKCDPAHYHRLGQKLLAHPTIKATILERQQARTKKFEVTAEYLVEKLTGILDRTQEDNPTAALRAIELLGKTIAVWRDKQEISGPDGAAIKHEQTIKENAADFSRRISGLAKRAGTSNVVSFPDSGGTGGT